jgi:hypothetical protein
MPDIIYFGLALRILMKPDLQPDYILPPPRRLGKSEIFVPFL